MCKQSFVELSTEKKKERKEKEKKIVIMLVTALSR